LVNQGALNRKLLSFFSSPNHLCFWTRGDHTGVCYYDSGTFITFESCSLVVIFFHRPNFKVKMKHDITGAGFFPILRQRAQDMISQVGQMSGVSFTLLLESG